MKTLKKKEPSILSTEIPIRIQFHDVDSMNVVWHGNYVKYFEEARSALFNQIGFHYQEMNASGFVFPIVDMQIKYIRSLVLNQIAYVRVDLVECENRLRLNFTILNEAKDMVHTRATTTQVAVCIATQEMHFEIPEVLIDAIAQAVERAKHDQP